MKTRRYKLEQITEQLLSIDRARQFVFGRYIDEPLAMDVDLSSPAGAFGAADARYFYHQNTIYSVYGLTDSGGGLIEAYEYDPYGRHILLTDGNDGDSVVNFTSNDTRAAMGVSTLGNPWTFTGRRFEPETGLHHYRMRYYDSERGRFLSQDPIGYFGGINLYKYTSANPTNLTDPSDLHPFPSSWLRSELRKLCKDCLLGCVRQSPLKFRSI